LKNNVGLQFVLRFFSLFYNENGKNTNPGKRQKRPLSFRCVLFPFQQFRKKAKRKRSIRYESSVLC